MSARFWPIILTSIALTGCAAVSGYPRPAFDREAERAELRSFVGPDAITRYEACADKTPCRNAIIDARVRAVDIAFAEFVHRIYGQEGRVSLGADLLATGLSSAAALSGAKALSAGAGLLTGSRATYEKQVLSLSLPLMFQEMVANRREILIRIRQGEALPAANYSLYQALDDIGDYEEAASLPAAAAAITSSAGSNARAADVRLEALRAAQLATTAAMLPAIAPAQSVAATAPLTPGAPAAIPAPGTPLISPQPLPPAATSSPPRTGQ